MEKAPHLIEVRRLELRDADGAYHDAFEVVKAPEDTRTAEQWARDLFERTSPLIRWFPRFCWRAILGLRGGPYPSPDHVLGWHILAKQADEIQLERTSEALRAQISIHIAESSVIWRTQVSYLDPAIRSLWAKVYRLHLWMVVRAMKSTASR